MKSQDVVCHLIQVRELWPVKKTENCKQRFQTTAAAAAAAAEEQQED